MEIKFRKPTIYCSHSIRGDGTISMEENCDYACKVADKIERTFPEMGLYVPARSDLSLQILWNAKKISVDDIIFADLAILKACHGWLWIYTSDSKGCEQECDLAHSLNLAGTLHRYEHCIDTDLLKANYGEVRRILNPIVEKAKLNYRNS